MAITVTRRMAARRLAIMGRAISITASSWAWARGRAGVTATAGVVIASVAVAAEDTSARVDTTADVDTPAVGMQPILDAARMQVGVMDIAVAAMPKRRVVARPVVARLPGWCMAADRMVTAEIAAGSVLNLAGMEKETAELRASPFRIFVRQPRLK